MANRNATSYTDTFDYLTGMVFDRTQADVTNKTSKGYWNTADLNRIEAAISTMSDYLSLGLSTKTWIMTEYISKSDYNLIYNNVESIRNVWRVSSDAPATPSINGFNFESANDLEKILSDFLDFKISAETDFKYSSQLIAGGEFNV